MPDQESSLIPTGRPVLGKDLEAFQQRLGCSTMRCCEVLGIPLSVWSQWKNHPEQPVPNPAAALLIRLYDRWPQLLPAEPEPETLKQALRQKLGRRVTLTELSLLLGRERTSGYRWSTRAAPSATVVSLVESLLKLLETKNDFEDYRQLVEQEARARGIPDIWAQQTWKVKQAETGESES